MFPARSSGVLVTFTVTVFSAFASVRLNVSVHVSWKFVVVDQDPSLLVVKTPVLFVNPIVGSFSSSSIDSENNKVTVTTPSFAGSGEAVAVTVGWTLSPDIVPQVSVLLIELPAKSLTSVVGVTQTSSAFFIQVESVPSLRVIVNCSLVSS